MSYAAHMLCFTSDVWEVDMPPGHRFPMSKYKKVRKAVQAHINDSEQQINATFEFLHWQHLNKSRLLIAKNTFNDILVGT
mmetsp:Transcript_12274/g.15683  ORF Transcript_12274/g.15683 Transcript_12274/m.15683 type:complete len:80 (+) Transcript_12274:562-801(+)